MREPEGIETPLPGKSSQRAWSKLLEPYVRNVEAVGSNPITSTKGPVQRTKVGAPGSYEALLSATGFVVELEDANPLSSRKAQLTGRQSCGWNGRRRDQTRRVSMCLYRRGWPLREAAISG